MKLFEKPPIVADLGNIHSVIAIGDSLMANFVNARAGQYFWKNLWFGEKHSDAFLSRNLRTVIRKTESQVASAGHNVGVLFGMAAWELLKPFGNSDSPIPGEPLADDDVFREHLDTLGKFVASIRGQFPMVKLYWKTGAYPHLHVVARDLGLGLVLVEKQRNLWYMSHERTMRLYELQKMKMKELDVPVLDIMEATYLQPDRPRTPGDGIHYDVEFNKMISSWYYPSGLNESMSSY